MTRRVLCLLLEFDWWETARPLTYSVQLGLEEGLRANGCRPLTVTTPWLPRLKEICGAERFDQVWVEIVHQALDDDVLDFIAGLAPVRVGFLLESLHYDEAIYAAAPHYRARAGNVRHRLKFLTHAAATDEVDATAIDAAGDVRACWWPQAVPARFVTPRPGVPRTGPAVFRGSLYGDRIALARDEGLRGSLVVAPPAERGTAYPRLFDRMQMAAAAWVRRRRPSPRLASAVHLFLLRRLRRQVFRRWMAALRSDAVVVNLPHSVGTYPGRVTEAMAAGRAVVTWDVPGRPRNRALFEDGVEIVLFSGREPAALASALSRLQRDPALASTIATNGWRKVRRAHTIERRVEQILAWTDTGEAPVFS
ncbi:MAG TPA: glycosyltransferase [Candidatus Acidoferrum sp.]|nr:glycosyltransferase [Candidatus Acidoferrum sp.]